MTALELQHLRVVDGEERRVGVLIRTELIAALNPDARRFLVSGLHCDDQ